MKVPSERGDAHDCHECACQSLFPPHWHNRSSAVHLASCTVCSLCMQPLCGQNAHIGSNMCIQDHMRAANTATAVFHCVPAPPLVCRAPPALCGCCDSMFVDGVSCHTYTVYIYCILCIYNIYINICIVNAFCLHRCAAPVSLTHSAAQCGSLPAGSHCSLAIAYIYYLCIAVHHPPTQGAHGHSHGPHVRHHQHQQQWLSCPQGRHRARVHCQGPGAEGEAAVLFCNGLCYGFVVGSLACSCCSLNDILWALGLASSGLWCGVWLVLLVAISMVVPASSQPLFTWRDCTCMASLVMLACDGATVLASCLHGGRRMCWAASRPAPRPRPQRAGGCWKLL